MAEVLQVEARQSRGKRNARRMRRAGTIPAVLYGHGEETVSLAVRTDAMAAAVRHGSHVVELAGAVQQSALIRDLQWDVWGTGILHVDFARVSADETIEVTVSVELRGEAPGVKEGGVVEHLVHEVEIECKATAVPEKIVVNINQLKLGEVDHRGRPGVAGGGQVPRRSRGDRGAMRAAGRRRGGRRRGRSRRGRARSDRRSQGRRGGRRRVTRCPPCVGEIRR